MLVQGGHTGEMPFSSQHCKCNFVFNLNSLTDHHGEKNFKAVGHYLHFYILCRFSAYGNILTPFFNLQP